MLDYLQQVAEEAEEEAEEEHQAVGEAPENGQ